jgi:hypothetical protein
MRFTRGFLAVRAARRRRASRVDACAADVEIWNPWEGKGVLDVFV